MNVLTLPVENPASFVLCRAGWLWTILHQFAIIGKIYTGDAAFDEEYFIRSPDVKWARAFFTDSETRRLARALFSMGCTRVALSAGSLQGSFKTSGGDEAAQALLSELSARLPAA